MLKRAVKRALKEGYSNSAEGVEYIYVDKDFSLPEGYDDDNLSVMYHNMKWKKLGDQSTKDCCKAKAVGDEAILTVTAHYTHKYIVKDVVDSYKVLRHKKGTVDDILVRPYESFWVYVSLHGESGSNYKLEVKDISGQTGYIEMERQHNIGYAKVLVRDFYGCPYHWPVTFADIQKSGRANMLKAVKMKEEVAGPLERPASQSVLKFATKKKTK